MTGKSIWINILAGIVLALVLFFIFVFSLNLLTHHGQSKSVPQVTGKTFEEAKKMLKDAGFEVEIQDSIYVDTAKPMRVLKQVPESDESVKINRTVFLTINRSVPPMVEMPNLVGYSYRSAEMALKNSNLRVGDTSFKPDFARNAVLEQRYNGKGISAGTKLQMGSSISLVLGDGVGDRQILVPNLVGLTYCEARNVLGASGIGIGSVMALSESVSDTCNAFIGRQRPDQRDDQGRYNRIRSGQLVDIWLQLEKPELNPPPPPTDEEEQ
ncbi:MAG: PASTA domain-containing protein [Chitinophagaceae bacterium]|nr:MAG: PASTA domain-containing protein [Chitinophagaceae bacterium]